MSSRRKPGRIEDIVLVSSGKGGVGKTTVSVNLAVALPQRGRKVALLDAVLYGPNTGLLLGIRRTEEASERDWSQYLPIVTGRQAPVERYGLRVMSVAFLVGDRQAIKIKSDLMLGKLAESLLYMVDWGDADTMVVDLPPGSDEPMETLVSVADVSGGVIVTTPQDVARLDAQRELTRFADAGLNLLGVVENMSYFACPHCGERQEVFHRGETYADLDEHVIGRIPLDAETSAHNDRGRPIVLSDSDGEAKSAFVELADTVVRKLGSR